MLLEVGAGYFIEKDIPGAKDYCDRKTKVLQESSTKVGQLINAKKMNLAKVKEELMKRVKAMQDQMEERKKQKWDTTISLSC